MEMIDALFENMNVYYSLLLYSGRRPDSLIRKLRSRDHAIAAIGNLRSLDLIEMNHRMFILDARRLGELLFAKSNRIDQYNLLLCVDDASFDIALSTLEARKPECIEKVFVTKIFF